MKRLKIYNISNEIITTERYLSEHDRYLVDDKNNYYEILYYKEFEKYTEIKLDKPISYDMNLYICIISPMINIIK